MFASGERLCPTSPSGRVGAASCSCSRCEMRENRLMRHSVSGLTLILIATGVAAGCRNNAGASADTSTVSATASSTSPEQSTDSHLLVAGDSLRLIEHPENLPAGFPLQIKPVPIKNTYEGGRTTIDSRPHVLVGGKYQ